MFDEIEKHTAHCMLHVLVVNETKYHEFMPLYILYTLHIAIIWCRNGILLPTYSICSCPLTHSSTDNIMLIIYYSMYIYRVECDELKRMGIVTMLRDTKNMLLFYCIMPPECVSVCLRCVLCEAIFINDRTPKRVEKKNENVRNSLGICVFTNILWISIDIYLFIYIVQRQQLNEHSHIRFQVAVVHFKSHKPFQPIDRPTFLPCYSLCSCRCRCRCHRHPIEIGWCFPNIHLYS